MLQLIPGDDLALRSRASQLSATASSIQTVVNHVRTAEHQVNVAGQNPITTSIASALQRNQTLLSSASSVLQQASQCLDGLAGELEQIDAEAVQERRRMEAGSGHAFLELTYLEPFLARADSARASAARQLGHLTSQAPGLPKSPHHSFLSDVWDGTIGSLLSGLWGLGKGAWSLTGEGFFNEKAWEKSWRDTAHGAEQIIEHPGAFGKAVVSAFADSDLRHRDLAAWVITEVFNVGSLFVDGLGILKYVSKLRDLSDAMDAGKAGDAAKLLESDPTVAANTKVISLQDGMLPDGTNAWSLKPFPRGFAVEKLIAVLWNERDANTYHLYQTHEGIDLRNAVLGKVVSIKSIDPASPTYVNSPAAFAGKLNGYAQKLVDYNPTRIQGKLVTPRAFQFKELVIGIPDTGLTPAQASKISDLLANNKYSSINITIVEVPR